jgi:hypothetical protein
MTQNGKQMFCVFSERNLQDFYVSVAIWELVRGTKLVGQFVCLFGSETGA